MIIVGEKLNSSIKEVREAIALSDEQYIANIARSQELSGADYLDINAGMFAGSEAERLLWLMEATQKASSLPLVIDTPDPTAAEAVLRKYSGKKPIINSISLEAKRFDPMLDLAKTYGTSIIALCMDDNGIPEAAQDKLDIAHKLVSKLNAGGISSEDIFIDPALSPISASYEAGKSTLDAIRLIRKNYPDIHIICGLSNVSFGLPKRHLINRTFLVCALTCGIDSAILDPEDKDIIAAIRATKTLLGKDEYCAAFLESFRSGLL